MKIDTPKDFLLFLLAMIFIAIPIYGFGVHVGAVEEVDFWEEQTGLHISAERGTDGVYYYVIQGDTRMGKGTWRANH